MSDFTPACPKCHISANVHPCTKPANPPTDTHECRWCQVTFRTSERTFEGERILISERAPDFAATCRTYVGGYRGLEPDAADFAVDALAARLRLFARRGDTTAAEILGDFRGEH